MTSTKLIKRIIRYLMLTAVIIGVTYCIYNFEDFRLFTLAAITATLLVKGAPLGVKFLEWVMSDDDENKPS